MGTAQPIVDGTTPGSMALSSIREAEQRHDEQNSKQRSSISSMAFTLAALLYLLYGLYISSCLQLPALFECLSRLLSMMDYNAELSAKYALFFPTCYWSRYFPTPMLTLRQMLFSLAIDDLP